MLFGRDDYGNERLSYVGRVCLMLAVIVAMVPMVGRAVASRWSGPSPALSTTHCRHDATLGKVLSLSAAYDHQLYNTGAGWHRQLSSFTAVPHLVILTELTDNCEFASC